MSTGRHITSLKAKRVESVVSSRLPSFSFFFGHSLLGVGYSIAAACNLHLTSLAKRSASTPDETASLNIQYPTRNFQEKEVVAT